MRLGPRPTIYELNTAVWLERLGRDDGRGRPLTLGEVPAAVWDALAALPVDAVWLMGVWQRSPAGLAIGLRDAGVQAANRAALPDLSAADNLGSPYCVRDYVVDARFGGDDALATARAELGARGLALILDYVPNHVAPDHPWLTERPGCFLPGTEEELAAHPEAFVSTAAGIVANGRDPYFPPWGDVVQLNAYAPELRAATVETLTALGGRCDALRCDMAMLMTNDVFGRTWGARVGAPPAEQFWPPIIAAVKAVHPDLSFIAETYWDLEWDLQQQGFDLCYDKRLYDRLVAGEPAAVRAHLGADLDYQERLVRFIENHDEPRAAATFGPARARAAAVVMATLPGGRLIHDGQLEGRRTRIPVQLGRGPDEPVDEALRAFYLRLLRALADGDLRHGGWQLCDSSDEAVLAWGWEGGRGRHLVVVRLADAPTSAPARVSLPWAGALGGRAWRLEDRLGGQALLRDGDALAAEGLDVTLEPWEPRLLAFVAA